MRILHVTEAAGYGVLRHISLVTGELSRRGHECGVLLFGGRICSDASFSCPCTIHRQSGGRLLNLSDSVRAIHRAVLDFRPDVIHLHAFTAGVAGRLAFSGCVYSPHAFSVHASVPFLSRSAVLAAEKILQRRTAGYALVSRNEKECAMKIGLPEEKLQVCINGLPDDFPERLLSREAARSELSAMLPEAFSGNCLAGVFPGRLVYQKNPGLILDAMERLGTGAPRIVFCGDGPLLEPLRKRNVSGVFFAGRVPDLSRLLRGFDFAVMPSRYEGMSYSFLECLAAGLPVIATDTCTGGLPLEGRVQILDDADDAAGLAEAISRVMPGGLAAPVISSSLSKQVDDLLGLYEDCSILKTDK